MRNEQQMLKLPRILMRQLKKNRRIFLSVNPVIAFSDVMMAIEASLSTNDETINVVSVEKLANLNGIDSRPALIACGDMHLKELPSYLRGIIHKEGLQDIIGSISESPWMALRVYISNTDDHVFEYLISDSLVDPEVHLFDGSWTKLSLLKSRFDKTVMVNGNGDPAHRDFVQSPPTKLIENDLIFME